MFFAVLVISKTFGPQRVLGFSTPMHSDLNAGHEQKFVVLEINKIMIISLPHTQDIMFHRNLGQIFA